MIQKTLISYLFGAQILVFILPSFANGRELFENQYPLNPERQRRENFGPAMSFLVPGLDQWIEGQYVEASFFSAMALAGVSLAIKASNEGGSEIEQDFTKGDRSRRYFYGLQLYSWAGGMSGYMSFRSTVNSMKSGKYDFLKESDESVLSVLSAPLEISYFKRWTTLIPLSAGLLASIAFISLEKSRGHFTGEDGFYSLAYSVNAGTYEEAVFRGWLLPLLSTGSLSANKANWIQAVLFGLAHYSEENRFPIFQTLFGYYLGWLTQHNQYSIRESVFIHTWWDIVVLSATFYSMSPKQKKNRAIMLPILSFNF